MYVNLYSDLLQLFLELINKRNARTNRVLDVVVVIDEIEKVKEEFFERRRQLDEEEQHLLLGVTLPNEINDIKLRYEKLIEILRKNVDMYELLRNICAPLDWVGSYWCLVTSLNPEAFLAVNFQRIINFFRLPIPSFEIAKDLFSTFHQQLKLPSNQRPSLAMQNMSMEQLDWLLLYCQGHWKTLERLFDKLQTSSSFEMVIDELMQDKQLISMVEGLNLDILRLVLIGEDVDKKAVINGVPISDYLGRGWLVNTHPDLASIWANIRPSLTLWQLYAWSQENDDSNPIVQNVKSLLNDMLRFDAELIKTGKGFEVFHLKWECLWSYIAQGILPRYRIRGHGPIDPDDAHCLRTLIETKKFETTDKPSFEITSMSHFKTTTFPAIDGLTIDSVIDDNGPNSTKGLWWYLTSQAATKHTIQATPKPISKKYDIVTLFSIFDSVKQTQSSFTGLDKLATSKLKSARALVSRLERHLKASTQNRINFCVIACWKKITLPEEKLKELKKLPDALKPYEKRIDFILVDAETMKSVYGPTISSLKYLYERESST